MAEPKNYLSPQEKLKQHYKTQAQKGANTVREGREKFSKNYLEPIIKTGAATFGLSFGTPLVASTLLSPKTLTMLAGNSALGYFMNKQDNPYLEAGTSVIGNIVKPQLNEQLKRVGGINDFLQAKKEFSKGNIWKGIFNTATGIGGVYDSDWIPGRYDDYVDKSLELLNVTGDLNDSYQAYKKYTKKFQKGGRTPQEKLKQYYKSQANKGAAAVKQGREQFTKNYVEPAAKFAGSFSPMGPVIGLTDSYNAYKKGDTAGAVLGAGLEALPYGLSKAKTIANFLKPAKKFTGYHASIEPTKVFKEKFPENYFAKHGGTDRAIFFTDKIPEEQSFLSKRPYLGKYEIKMKRPYIKDFSTPIEGGTSRWAESINFAERHGYDGAVIKGIRDNQMDNSTIYVSLNPKKVSHKDWIKQPKTTNNIKYTIEGPAGEISNFITPSNFSQFRKRVTPIIKGKNLGVQWFNNWTSHPEFNTRVQNLEINDIKTKLGNPRFKSLPDRILGSSDLDKGIAINNKISSPLQAASTTVHELSHAKFRNKFINTDEFFRKNSSIPQEIMDRIAEGETINAREVLDLKHKINYLTDPSEVYARINQLRLHTKLRPGESVSPIMSEIIHNEGLRGEFPIDPYWFKLMKSSNALQKMLNTFPTIGGVTAGVGILNNNSNNNLKK